MNVRAPAERGASAPVVIERAGGGISRVTTDTGPLQGVRSLARDGAELLGVARAAVWRLGPEGVPARCLTRYHREARVHDDDLAYPDALGREAWRLLERLSILAMEDVLGTPPATPALGRYLEESSLRAILAVPVRAGGRLIGFLSFEETQGPRSWSAGDREQAATLAFRLEQHWHRAGGGSPPPPPSAAVDPPIRLPADPPHPPASPRPEPPVTRAVEGSRHNDSDAPAARPAEPSGHTGAVASSFGHRRELRARLQRLRTLERSGILGSDAATRAVHALHVQAGTLALLFRRLGSEGREAELVTDAIQTLDEARGELERFLAWTRHGQRDNGPIELNELVGELAVRLGKLTGDRVGLLYAPSSEPVMIRAEPGLLGRALEELVRNARAASSVGDRVRVAVQRGEEPGGRALARLVVEDHGTGIESSDLPWIFEPWFTTRKDGSEGMGLPMVQAVVEGHGGWVDVTSTRGVGTRFILNFPIAPPLPEAPEDTEVGDEGSVTVSRGADREPPLALLVQDEPLLARMLRRALEDAGFEVREAEGGPEAHRLVQASVHDAALVVTERILPDGSEGMALIRAGRAQQPYLGGIVVDRRLRTGRDGRALLHARAASRIPTDVRLLAHPVDAIAFAQAARELVDATVSRAEGADEAGDRADSSSESVNTLH